MSDYLDGRAMKEEMEAINAKLEEIIELLKMLVAEKEDGP